MALAKKEITCPGCQRTLRVPVKTNKVLRITCPRCQNQFDIQFTNPLKDVFTFDKGKSFSDNLALMMQRFNALPGRAKFVILAFIISIALLISSFVNLMSQPTYEEPGLIDPDIPVSPKNTTPEQNKGLLLDT